MVIKVAPFSTPAEHRAFVARNLTRAGFPLVRWDTIGDRLVKAEVNHGRWIGPCPVPYCHGAELVAPGMDMVCCGCGGGPWAVVWPDDKLYVEQVLGRRPDPATRNWKGETVAELQRENEMHEVI